MGPDRVGNTGGRGRWLPTGRGVLGAVLVVGAATAVLVLGRGNDPRSETAWLVMARDVGAGATITPTDLDRAPMDLGPAAATAVEDPDDVVGHRALRPLGRGEVVTRRSLGSGTVEDGPGRELSAGRLARRIAPGGLHRLLWGVALASTVARSVPDRPPPAPTPGAPAMPTETSTPGPPPSLLPEPEAAPTAAPPAPAVWEVRSGDHFWLIAEETLTRRRGAPPSDVEVARYWRTLIERNRERLVEPANPDLILPGQRFELPP